ncbi:MAG: site-specific integrase [Pirellulales bacterium]
MREPKPFFRRQTQSWYVQIGNQQISLGRNKEAAWEEYHQIMAARRSEQPTPNDSVVSIINKHLAWLKANRAEGTFNRAMQHLPHFGQHIGPKMRVSALRPFHVQEWLDEKYANCSDGYRNTVVTTIKRAFSWAAEFGYIHASPIAKMPKPPAGVREFVVSSDQWQAVLDAATDTAFREFLVVMLVSGARPQEMCRMEKRHFQPNFRRVQFPASESKGKKTPRSIYLPDEAFAIVSRLVEKQGEGYIFRNRLGNPWNKDSVNCRFRRMKRVLKLPKLCAYTLRHSYAHHRLVSGMDAHVVSKLLGHSDMRMLATRYGHLEQKPDYLATQANSKSAVVDLATSPRRDSA